MSWQPSDLLIAGGVGTEPTDQSSAANIRHYRHPALPDRVFARLQPAELLEAEDLAAGTLGLVPDGTPTEVGHLARQALGFPAWALINDPDNARYALDLVKDLERAGRLAKSSPKAALDLITGLAAQLGRSVPHFLPSFLEEAGRSMLRADNRMYATQLFGRAREAERVHGLPVDESRQREVFLEFAFAGALSVKALTEEARDLARRQDAEQALQLFSQLCVERVAGGLPPQASLGPDLRRLAKAAGHDQAAAEQDALRAILDLPALLTAPAGFWTKHTASLTALFVTEPTLARGLLNKVPQALTITDWIDLLDTFGALDQLATFADDDVHTVLVRLIQHAVPRWGGAGGRSARLLALVAEHAPALHRTGRPVEFDRPWGVDLDILDLLLSHGIEVTITDEDGTLPAQEWACDDTPGGRSLSAVADHPVFGPMLRVAVQDAILNDGWRSLTPEQVERLVLAEGSARLIHQWLTESLQKAAAPEATLLQQVLLVHHTMPLAQAHTDHGFAADVFEQMTTVDLGAGLAASLHAGLPHEWSWPAFDEAVAALGEPLADLSQFDAWPEVMLVSQAAKKPQLAVVGNDTIRRLEQVTLTGYYYGRVSGTTVGDDVLLTWYATGGQIGCWLSNPAVDFPLEAWHDWPANAHTLPTADGRRVVGRRLLTAASTPEEFSRASLVGDGHHFWTVDDDGAWVELDPDTGKLGRKSLPQWASQSLEAAGRGVDAVRYLDLQACPDELTDTLVNGGPSRPDGNQPALLGVLAFEVAPDTWRVVTPSGLSLDIPEPKQAGSPRRLFVLPTRGGEPVLVINELLIRADGALLAALGSEHFPDPFSTAHGCWYQLRPRDEQVSARLRGITSDELEDLIDTATEDQDPVAVRPTVAGLLGADVNNVALHPLLDAVYALARVANDLAGGNADPGNEQAPAELRDGRLVAALGEWGNPNDTDSDYYRLLLHADHALHALEGKPLAPVDNVNTAIWASVMNQPEAWLVRAASPATSAEDRATLRALLREMLDRELIGPHLRVVRLERPEGTPTDAHQEDSSVLTGPSSRFLVINEPLRWGGIPQRTAIEVGPPSGPPNGLAVEPVVTSARDTTLISTVLEQLEAAGDDLPDGDPTAPQRLADASGLTVAEAALLVAGAVAGPNANVDDAVAARAATMLSVASTASRRRIIGAGAHTALVERGPDVGAVADAVRAEYGTWQPIADDAVFALMKALPHTDDVAATLRRLLGTQEPSDHALPLVETVQVLLWLGQQLDGADPLRARLPHWWTQVLAELGSAEPVVVDYPNDEVQRHLGAKPEAGVLVHQGAFTLSVGAHPWQTQLRIVPKLLTDADTVTLALADSPETRCLAWLLANRDLPDRWAREPSASGAALDPTCTAPDVVLAVAEAVGVDADAAALYLMLLALPDPTARNIKVWTGWKPARLKAAEAALEAARLDDEPVVVRAKRSRAGRELFLPGGWVELKNPALPVEEWKVPDLEVGGDLTQFGQHALLLLRPPSEQFARAWQRVVDGDRPGYSEIVARPRRPRR